MQVRTLIGEKIHFQNFKIKTSKVLLKNIHCFSWQ